MRFFAQLWMTVASVYGVLFYVGVIGTLVVVERYFIRKRSKGELILPVIVIICALLLSITSFHQKSLGGGQLGANQIMIDNTTAGVIQVVTDDAYRLHGFGEYITNAGKESEFITLTIDEDRKVTYSSQPLPLGVKEEIEESFSHFKSIKAGSSKPYAELIKLDEEVNHIERSLSWVTFVYGFVWYGIPVCVIWGMYLISLFSRKRRRAFDKARLEDL